jgi:hypothetical protein
VPHGSGLTVADGGRNTVASGTAAGGKPLILRPAEAGVSPTRRLSHQSRRQTMPAKSKAQQKTAGAALSAKRGDTKKSELQGPSKSMYESMSEEQLEELAETSRKGKPEHVDS